MKKLNLPYNRQYIDSDDINSVVNALKGDFITTGPEASLFEEDIAQYAGAKYAVVFSSGTAALHLSLLALQIDKHETVLTSPITFVADANAALFVGAQITFSDILNTDANLDLSKLRTLLESRTDIKVIIPVHFAGQPVDIVGISNLAHEFGVTIIEDACHALGASYFDSEGKEIKVGSCKHSSMCVFSFHPIKSITTGEGGAITTNDINIYEKLLKLRSHGITRSSDLIQNKELGFTDVDGILVANPWYYEMQDLAPNYRISDFQCALGRSQLKKIDKFINRREHLSNIYRKEIYEKLHDKVTPLCRTNCGKNSHHLFVVKINFDELKGGRAAFMIFLNKFGIQTQVNYMPIYMHPFYRQYLKNRIELPEAEKYYSECLSLPLFVEMTDNDPIEVVKLIKKAFSVLKK